MEPRIGDDPGDEEAGGARDETFFGQFPRASKLALVNTLQLKGFRYYQDRIEMGMATQLELISIYACCGTWCV